MIYQHIWEAKLFIKMLYRMANLLCGKDYDWNVKIPIKKTDFFQNQVITSFKNAKCKLQNSKCKVEEGSLQYFKFCNFHFASPFKPGTSVAFLRPKE